MEGMRSRSLNTLGCYVDRMDEKPGGYVPPGFLGVVVSEWNSQVVALAESMYSHVPLTVVAEIASHH